MSAYTDTAMTIFESGLGNPLPISPKHKGPLVAGWHGRRAGYMEREDVEELIAKHAGGDVNIGVRLRPNIIGIDVDAHSGKKGAKSLKRLTKRLGPLPATWVSTARDLPNGIRLYRVGKRLAAADLPASIAGEPDIDLVSAGDMYVQCAPSIHQKIGEPYRWEHTGTRETTTSPPRAADLPKLPKAWQRAILGEAEAATSFAAAAPAPAHKAIAEDDDDAVAYAIGVLEGTAELRGEHSSRHKAVAAMVLRLTFNDNEDGIDTIKEAWFGTMPDVRGKKEARREWANIVKSARQRAEEPAETPRAASEGRKVKAPAIPASMAQRGTEGTGGTEYDPDTPEVFPVGAMPMSMQIFADEVVRARQVPLGLVAPTMFAALSAATAGGIVVRAPDGYEYGTSVYFIGVANPSERKSSILSTVLTHPLRTASNAVKELHAGARTEAEARVKVMAKNLSKLERSDGTEINVLVDAQVALDESEEELAALVPPAFVASDPTQEALAQLMAAQFGVGVVASAEGAFIETLAGQYNNGRVASLALVNDGWSRGTVRTLRVSREEVFISTAHLVIAALVQDSVAEKLGASGFESTGFLSRVFFTKPAPMVGERQPFVGEMDPGIAYWWDQTLTALLTRGWGHTDEPIAITMSDGAVDEFVRWFRRCELLSNDVRAVQGWWAKAAEMAVRVAVLMALAVDPGVEVLSAKNMAGGVRIVEFFAREQGRFFTGVIDPFLGVQNDRLYRRAHRRICVHYGAGDTFTSSDMAQALKGARTPVTTEDINPILAAVAADTGLIAPVETKRKDSQVWEVVSTCSEDNTGIKKPKQRKDKRQVREQRDNAKVPKSPSTTKPPAETDSVQRDRDIVIPKSGNQGSNAGARKSLGHKDEAQHRDHRDHSYKENPYIQYLSSSSVSEADSPSESEISSLRGDPDPYVPNSPVLGDPGENGDRPAVYGETIFWEFAGKQYPIHLYTPDREIEFRAWLRRTPITGFDTETTGLRTFSGDTPRLVQFASEDEAWVIPASETQIIRFAIETATLLYAHNAGFDVQVVAEHCGVDFEAVSRKVVDTAILAHLVDPRTHAEGGTGQGLKALSDAYLAAGASDSDKALKDEAKRLGIKVGNRFAEIPADNRLYVTYAGADAILALRLGKVLKDVLAEREIVHYESVLPGDVELTDDMNVVVGVEHRIAQVAWDMKRRGIKIDREAADALHKDLAEREAAAMAFLAEWGIDSPNKNAQVAAAIVDEDVYELKATTSKGALSVASHVLDAAIAEGSEVARQVHEAKKMKRYRSVYVDGLLDYTDENDMLHPDIRALRAVTGRMAISDPPLQQIPADMTEVRSLFIPSKRSYRIVSADFSQIEARVLAALAGDPVFYGDVVGGDKAEGTDIHSQTARLAFGDKFTNADRDMAKRIVFGKLYGGGIETLSRSSGASREATTAVVEAFNDRYAGVRSYAQRLETRAKRGSGIYLPSGRLVKFGPDGEYKALNYMIQGTARDLFVVAVLRLVDAGYADSLLLPIHDEVLMQLPAKGIKAAAAKVAKIMSTTFGGVELPVGVGYGKDWGNAAH